METGGIARHVSPCGLREIYDCEPLSAEEKVLCEFELRYLEKACRDEKLSAAEDSKPAMDTTEAPEPPSNGKDRVVESSVDSNAAQPNRKKGSRNSTSEPRTALKTKAVEKKVEYRILRIDDECVTIDWPEAMQDLRGSEVFFYSPRGDDPVRGRIRDISAGEVCVETDHLAEVRLDFRAVPQLSSQEP